MRTDYNHVQATIIEKLGPGKVVKFADVRAAIDCTISDPTIRKHIIAKWRRKSGYRYVVPQHAPHMPAIRISARRLHKAQDEQHAFKDSLTEADRRSFGRAFAGMHSTSTLGCGNW